MHLCASPGPDKSDQASGSRSGVKPSDRTDSYQARKKRKAFIIKKREREGKK